MALGRACTPGLCGTQCPVCGWGVRVAEKTQTLPRQGGSSASLPNPGLPVAPIPLAPRECQGLRWAPPAQVRSGLKACPAGEAGALRLAAAPAPATPAPDSISPSQTRHGPRPRWLEGAPRRERPQERDVQARAPNRQPPARALTPPEPCPPGGRGVPDAVGVCRPAPGPLRPVLRAGGPTRLFPTLPGGCLRSPALGPSLCHGKGASRPAEVACVLAPCRTRASVITHRESNDFQGTAPRGPAGAPRAVPSPRL